MNKWCLVCLLSCFLFIDCKKVSSNIQNLNGGRIYIIGHEGSGEINAQYPPDSWEGVTRAVEYDNADGVEVDLQLSSDSVLFMFEGNSLDASTSGIGCVLSLDSEALSHCIYKNTQTLGDLSAKYVAAFERLVQRFSQRSIKPIIFMDLHTSTGCVDESMQHAYYTALVAAAEKILQKYNAYSWIYLQSYVPEWLAETLRQYPQTKVMYDGTLDDGDIEYARNSGFYGIASKNDNISADQVKAAHTAGLHVQLYGADGQNDMVNAMNKSPDYFLTDNIPLSESMLQ